MIWELIVPDLIMFNAMNRAGTYVVEVRDRLKGIASRQKNAHFASFFLVQFCLVVACAALIAPTTSATSATSATSRVALHTTFSCCVCHVVGVGTQPKMVRVNAGRDVTAVADVHAWRDVTFVEDVGQPMRADVTARQSGLAVTVSAYRGTPQPTTVFIDRIDHMLIVPAWEGS